MSHEKCIILKQSNEKKRTHDLSHMTLSGFLFPHRRSQNNIIYCWDFITSILSFNAFICRSLCFVCSISIFVFLYLCILGTHFGVMLVMWIKQKEISFHLCWINWSIKSYIMYINVLSQITKGQCTQKNINIGQNIYYVSNKKFSSVWMTLTTTLCVCVWSSCKHAKDNNVQSLV